MNDSLIALQDYDNFMFPPHIHNRMVVALSYLVKLRQRGQFAIISIIKIIMTITTTSTTITIVILVTPFIISSESLGVNQCWAPYS